jgi:formylglycine-generating enzyme required for sulfatase activity
MLNSFYAHKFEITNYEFCKFLNSYGVSSSGSYAGNYLIYLTSSTLIYHNGSQFAVKAGFENYPAVNLSWYGAAAYCNWLSQSKGYQKCYNESSWSCDFIRDGFRLPTEAKWEYAARGGSAGRGYKYSGSDLIDPVAWYSLNSVNPANPLYQGKGTFPVGQKAANELGIHDSRETHSNGVMTGIRNLTTRPARLRIRRVPIPERIK